jgi:hypothetical protein
LRAYQLNLSAKKARNALREPLGLNSRDQFFLTPAITAAFHEATGKERLDPEPLGR